MDWIRIGFMLFLCGLVGATIWKHRSIVKTFIEGQLKTIDNIKKVNSQEDKQMESEQEQVEEEEVVEEKESEEKPKKEKKEKDPLDFDIGVEPIKDDAFFGSTEGIC